MTVGIQRCHRHSTGSGSQGRCCCSCGGRSILQSLCTVRFWPLPVPPGWYPSRRPLPLRLSPHPGSVTSHNVCRTCPWRISCPEKFLLFDCVVSYSYHKRQGVLPPECDCRYKEACSLFLFLSLLSSESMARCHPARTYSDRNPLWKFCCYLIVVLIHLTQPRCIYSFFSGIRFFLLVLSQKKKDSLCLSLYIRPSVFT